MSFNSGFFDRCREYGWAPADMLHVLDKCASFKRVEFEELLRKKIAERKARNDADLKTTTPEPLNRDEADIPEPAPYHPGFFPNY